MSNEERFAQKCVIVSSSKPPCLLLLFNHFFISASSSAATLSAICLATSSERSRLPPPLVEVIPNAARREARREPRSPRTYVKLFINELPTKRRLVLLLSHYLSLYPATCHSLHQSFICFLTLKVINQFFPKHHITGLATISMTLLPLVVLLFGCETNLTFFKTMSLKASKWINACTHTQYNGNLTIDLPSEYLRRRELA